MPVNEPQQREAHNFIGVDRNTTGHPAVVVNPRTGKVWKLGKQANHTYRRYWNIRERLQKNGKFGLLKKLKDRESRIIRELNHKISMEIVNIADQNNAGIRLENLEGVRNAPNAKSFRYSLDSWSFYQLQNMIEYMSKLLGIPLEYVAPGYTSQLCSRCGMIGRRDGKEFGYACRHVDNADVNASSNIALRHGGDISIRQRQGFVGGQH